MRKLLFLFSFLVCLFAFSSEVEATSLISINKEGEVIFNVLSSKDEIALGIPKRELLEVREIAAGSSASFNSRISLTKQEDKLLLKVKTNEGEKDLDVTNWEEDIVEIEERGEVKKVIIGLVGDKFKLEQEGVIVLTDYPINIDPTKNELSVLTPSGSRFISVLPIEAVESLLRARAMNRFKVDKKVQLTESERGELIYVIEGERVINVFNLLTYSVPIRAKVSALTGEIIFIEQPLWLKVLGFLLT
jgi:hypothetical protein